MLYVKPTEYTTCPGEPCHTLDEYALSASQYFVSDTTVKFLPGTHNLSQPLNISGVNNLSLITRNATRNETVIRLSEALWFTNVSNLTFVDCNFSKSNGSIIVDTSQSVTFSDCNFPDSVNYWHSTNPFVYLVTSHNVTFIDCDFSGNRVANVVQLTNTSHVTFINCNFSVPVGSYKWGF